MMVSWCVRYRFKSEGRWVESFMYFEAVSPEAAKAKAELMLTNSKTVQWEILGVRMVGEGR